MLLLDDFHRDRELIEGADMALLSRKSAYGESIKGRESGLPTKGKKSVTDVFANKKAGRRAGVVYW